jgi:carbon storage regulator
MRRAGEAIYIGPNIVITLVSLERNRARIGIEAPRDVVVDRAEIAFRKRHEAAREARGEKIRDDVDNPESCESSEPSENSE